MSAAKAAYIIEDGLSGGRGERCDRQPKPVPMPVLKVVLVVLLLALLAMILAAPAGQPRRPGGGARGWRR